MSEAVITFDELTSSSTGDNMEVTARDGHFNFTVEEPWAGCTESGFGQQCSVGLSAEQARQLRDWLTAHLDAITDEPR
jgi:hypothetical protein